MTDSKHTPGNWRTGEDDNGSLLSVFANGEIVCDCDFPSDPERATANARLIAAAPELLAALQMMCSEWGDDQDWDGMRQACAVIAKAKGESK
jgi:hypothetical protein